jgi:beta-lactamase regulating signal transducer with metallopeptidase domain
MYICVCVHFCLLCIFLTKKMTLRYRFNSQNQYIFDLFLGLKEIYIYIYLQILYNTYIIKLNVSKIIFENQHKVIETRALAASYSKK